MEGQKTTTVSDYEDQKGGKYKAYKKYRNSDIDWLDKIPKTWKTTRLRNIFDIENGSTPKSTEEDYWGGDIAWATPDDLEKETKNVISETRRCLTKEGLDACGATLVPKGSILLSTRAPIGHLGVANVPITTNQGCKSLVFKESDNDEMYFYYFLKAAKQELKSLGAGSTYDELNSRHLKTILLAVPPQEEQEAIVEFLNEETIRIEQLIEKKQALIDLLEEKKQTLITELVSGGQSDSELTDIEEDWIGQKPVNWANLRLKRWLDQKIKDGPHETPEYVEEGIPFLSADSVRDGKLDFDRRQGDISEELNNKYQRKVSPKKHDIFLVKSGATTGKMAMVKTERDFSIWSPIAVIRADKDIIEPKFLYYALKSDYAQAQIEKSWSDGTQENLGMGDLERINIIAPQIPEQKEIVEEIEEESQKIEKLSIKIQEGIDRLKEYRTALITEAVTGQIDVRGEV